MASPSRRSLSGHQSPAPTTTTWLTPPEILRPLGLFDLDPCAAPLPRPWPTAKEMISLPNDGLASQWFGRVWLNPPFGKEAAAWLSKLSDHGEGIALIPARTETVMFAEHIWGKAAAVCFIKGRPHFHYPNGDRAPYNSGAPLCLIGYGRKEKATLQNCGLGFVVLAGGA